MNVVITMTSLEVKLVKMGVKKIIVQRFAPCGFVTGQDSVFVIEKGTGRVALILHVSHFVCSSNYSSIWRAYGTATGISNASWVQLTDGKPKIHLWLISEAKEPTRNIAFERVFNVQCPPRNYAYTSVCQDSFQIDFSLSLRCLWVWHWVMENAVQ